MGPHRKHFRQGKFSGSLQKIRKDFMWGKLRCSHHKIFDFVMGKIGDLLYQPRLTDLLRTRSTPRVRVNAPFAFFI